MFSLSPKLSLSSFAKPLLLITFLIAGVFLLSGTAGAEGEQNWCLCHSNLDEISPSDDVTDTTKFLAECRQIPTGQCGDIESDFRRRGILYAKCEKPSEFASGNDDSHTGCTNAQRQWNADRDSRTGYRSTFGAIVGKFLPKCVTEDVLEDNCKDISIFVQLLLNIANAALAVIGSLALVFFVFGGFTLILSQGNPEKVKKGRDILVAAVIGLIIAFAAYVVIRFLGEAVGLQEGFRLKQ